MKPLTRPAGIVRLGLLMTGVLASPVLLRAEVPAGNSGTQTQCQTCHVTTTKTVAAESKNEEFKDNIYVKQFETDKYIQFNAAEIWEKHDPHSLAYKAIDPDQNPVAKRMQDFLKGDKPKYEVLQDSRCLTCHATDLNPMSKAARTADEFLASNFVGVGCTACHGVSGDWKGQHFDGQTVNDTTADDRKISYLKFRVLPGAEKAQKHGLRDLRNPDVKADLCASCHVGNPDEKKVITHDMYAAGHPPLPPLEVLTFMESEPRHWSYAGELPFITDYAKRKPKEAWDAFRAKPADKENPLVRHVAAGAMASLRAEMKLLEAEAKRADAAKDGLDYARFDCYSCHHDLKYPSARQERGYPGRIPGRPPLKAWTAALPGVVIANAGGLNADLQKLAGDFPTVWKAVSVASTSNPFGYGKGDEIARAANAMVAWTGAFGKAMEGTDYSAAAGDKLAADVAKAVTAAEWYGDTEAAMNLLWAYRSLAVARGKDVKALDELKQYLPTRVRDTAGYGVVRKTTTFLEANPMWKGPIPAGTVLEDRQRKFGHFDPAAFNPAFVKAIGGQ